MPLSSNLYPQCIDIKNIFADKNQTLMDIAELAKKSGELENIQKEKIYQALVKREEIGSTGFSNGIAIPHCILDDCSKIIVGILINHHGVDFDSMDGKKAKIFFFIIAPPHKRNSHIQILSSISRITRSSEKINEILNAKTADRLIEIVNEHVSFKSLELSTKPQVMVNIFIQAEDYFHDILQFLSEISSGSISITETYNAAHYLHSLPLFSTFWVEDKNLFSRVIQIIVDKDLANNVIRGINTIVEDIESKAGVLITAQELFYSQGKLDF